MQCFVLITDHDSSVCVSHVVLTGEEWVELQGVELCLLHAAALEELWRETSAGRKRQRWNILTLYMNWQKTKHTNAPEKHIWQGVLSFVLQPSLFNAERDVAVFSSVTEQLLVLRYEQKVTLVFHMILCTNTHTKINSLIPSWTNRKKNMKPL